jgi:flagellar motility protein MotE (MotC chaperone)
MMREENPMETRNLSDIQIKVRIVPKRVRWPEAHSSPAWVKAHSCVDAFEDLVRNVDVSCLQAEQDKNFSASAVRRRRAEIHDQALRKLTNFKPFEIAEKALNQNIDALERLSDRNPEQVQTLQKLKQGLLDLREGIGATRRMVRDQCRTNDGTLVLKYW